MLVHHWDVERHRLEAHLPAEFMNEEDKKQLLRAVAHHMQQGRHGLAGNAITLVELEGVFTGYFETTWNLPRKEAVTLAREMIDQFHTRNFILCKRGPKLYGFVHRAFLEFFCAAEFVDRRRNTEDFSVDDLKELFRAHWQDKNWHEVLRLICGMEADLYAAALVRALAVDVEEWSSDEYEPRWSLVLAVQCFGEMDKLGVDEKLGPDLLQCIFRAAETNSLAMECVNFLFSSLIPAVDEIGIRWPGREAVFEWWRPFDASQRGPLTARAGLDFLACLQSDHWRTPKLLRDGAVNGKNSLVRRKALSHLAKGWRDDPQTLSLLHDRATNDVIKYVRTTALSELADGWPDDPQTLSLLRDRAVHDVHPVVHGRALSELTKCWRDHPQTLSFLRDLAVKEDYPSRGVALSELAKGWQDDPQTLTLLSDRAVNDEDFFVRCTALSELTEGWPNDLEVQKFVQKQRSKDPR